MVRTTFSSNITAGSRRQPFMEYINLIAFIFAAMGKYTFIAAKNSDIKWQL
ncbi:hypothetical protein AB6A23_00165 [Paenibacillus tarimensis]